MDKLTDLEICKRIAEIEGAKETLYSYSSFNTPKELTAVFDSRTVFNYNPLTDDALCFKLMVKYKAWRWSNPAEGKFNAWNNNVNGWVSAKTLNCAICLAIIQSKDQ